MNNKNRFPVARAVVRTSQTDPLHIAALRPLTATGSIGITLCPGKRGVSAIGAPWARDMATDMRVVNDWVSRHCPGDAPVPGAPIGAIVTLMEAGELAHYAARYLGNHVAAGIAHYHLPIVDVSIPDAAWFVQWRTVVAHLCGLLLDGRNVLVHCRGGLGRSGLVAALLLVELGEDPADAIRRVRQTRPGAIETSEQANYVLNYIPVDSGLDALAARRQRFARCLLGGAIGDALGAPVEFMKRREIRARLGPRGLQGLQSGSCPLGSITDDTQMTLFTAEGLLRAEDCAPFDLDAHVRSVSQSYQHWLLTQRERSRLGATLPRESVLLADQRLHHRRAPGNTCLGALRSATRLDEPADNDSKGCGAVMRVVPVGLYVASRWLSDDPTPAEVNHAIVTAWELGARTGGITHGNADGKDAAGLVAALTVALAHLPDADRAVNRVRAALGERGDAHRAMLPLLSRVVALAHRGRAEGWQGDDHAAAVASLGEGWVADEAAAMAIYCLLVAGSFREGVLMAADIDGDSDSVAAIAGNLLALTERAGSLPTEWLAVLELRAEIAAIGEALARSAAGGVPLARAA